MPEHWERLVPCRDAAGRERQMLVTVTDAALVALVPPPGGSASWPPSHIARVQEALLAAQIEALHRGGGSR